MLSCNIVNTFIPFAMAQAGMIHPCVLAPYLYYQAKTFGALRNFKKTKASTQSAKQVKRTAYYPFVILLAGFFATTAAQRYQERRAKDEEIAKGKISY